MPGKGTSAIKDYLAKHKNKISDYVDEEGSNEFTDQGLQLIVSKVAPGATFRDIQIVVTPHGPSASSYKHYLGKVLARVSVEVGLVCGPDDLSEKLFESYKNRKKATLS
ncbi:MAG: hypothetical protein M1830_005249, partial [Pleopsidium flavum]